MPKKGASLTSRIRAILERYECPEDRLDELTAELREMACEWRDERGSNGRRQGTAGGLGHPRRPYPTQNFHDRRIPRMPDELL